MSHITLVSIAEVTDIRNRTIKTVLVLERTDKTQFQLPLQVDDETMSEFLQFALQQKSVAPKREQPPTDWGQDSNVSVPYDIPDSSTSEEFAEDFNGGLGINAY